jgi:S-adenosylmethionine/arginine decarboxylase-like enzyme
MEDNYWGYHLILDAAECDHNAITDHDTIYSFVKQLVKDIDMVAFGEPQIVDFGEGDKAGYTLVQLIETSNICAHFVNERDHLYLDVFSCKKYDPQTVIDVAKAYFKFQKYNTGFLKRQAPTI